MNSPQLLNDSLDKYYVNNNTHSGVSLNDYYNPIINENQNNNTLDTYFGTPFENNMPSFPSSIAPGQSSPMFDNTRSPCDSNVDISLSPVLSIENYDSVNESNNPQPFKNAGIIMQDAYNKFKNSDLYNKIMEIGNDIYQKLANYESHLDEVGQNAEQQIDPENINEWENTKKNIRSNWKNVKNNAHDEWQDMLNKYRNVEHDDEVEDNLNQSYNNIMQNIDSGVHSIENTIKRSSDQYQKKWQNFTKNHLTSVNWYVVFAIVLILIIILALYKKK